MKRIDRINNILNKVINFVFALTSCIVIGIFVRECTYNDYSHNECVVNLDTEKNIE